MGPNGAPISAPRTAPAVRPKLPALVIALAQPGDIPPPPELELPPPPEPELEPPQPELQPPEPPHPPLSPPKTARISSAFKTRIVISLESENWTDVPKGTNSTAECIVQCAQSIAPFRQLVRIDALLLGRRRFHVRSQRTVSSHSDSFPVTLNSGSNTHSISRRVSWTMSASTTIPATRACGLP